jgi:hypothetical protein
VISVPPEGGSRSQLRVRTAPCPSGSASETNNECQIKFELLQIIVKKTRCGPFPLPAPYRRSVPVTTISLSLLPHFEQTSRSSHSSTGVSAS